LNHIWDKLINNKFGNRCVRTDGHFRRYNCGNGCSQNGMCGAGFRHFLQFLKLFLDDYPRVWKRARMPGKDAIPQQAQKEEIAGYNIAGPCWPLNLSTPTCPIAEIRIQKIDAQSARLTVLHGMDSVRQIRVCIHLSA